MTRFRTAFFLAPLLVPLALWFAIGQGALPIVLRSIIPAYLLMLLLFLPVSIVFLSYRRTSILVFAGAGVLYGFGLYAIYMAFLGQEALHGNFGELLKAIEAAPLAALADIGMAGAFGAVIGAIFWLIARPDRDSQLKDLIQRKGK